MNELAARVFGSWVHRVDPREPARRPGRRRARRPARPAARDRLRDAGRPAARVRPLHRRRPVHRRGPVRLELARRLGADQCQLARPVRDAGAARCRRLARLHRARARRHRAGRHDAVPDRRAAPRHDRQLHLARGAARLHGRRGGADRALRAARPARLAAADRASPRRPGRAPGRRTRSVAPAALAVGVVHDRRIAAR